MGFNKEVYNNMLHMTGLNYRRRPYRNYFNSGYKRDKSLDFLVSKGLATVKNRGKEMGGYYYYLTKNGFRYMLDRPSIFDIDKRIKKLETLWQFAHW